MTPEEYFLKEEPRPFLRLFEPSNYIERDEAASTGIHPTNPSLS